MTNQTKTIDLETRELIVKQIITDIKDKETHANIVAFYIQGQMIAGHINTVDHAILAKLFSTERDVQILAESSTLGETWANPFFHHEVFKNLFPIHSNFTLVWQSIAKSFELGTEKTLRETLFENFLNYWKDANDFPEKMMSAFLSDEVQETLKAIPRQFQSMTNDRAIILNEHFLSPIYSLLVSQMLKCKTDTEKYNYCVRNHSLPQLFLLYLQDGGDISLQRLLDVLNQWTVCMSKYADKVPFTSSTFTVSFEVIAHLFNKHPASTSLKIEFVHKATECLHVFAKYRKYIRNWMFSFTEDDLQKAFRDEIKKETHESFIDAVATGHVDYLVMFTTAFDDFRAIKKWAPGKSVRELLDIAVKVPLKEYWVYELVQKSDEWKIAKPSRIWEWVKQSRSETLMGNFAARIRHAEFTKNELPNEVWVGMQFAYYFSAEHSVKYRTENTK